VQGYEPPPVLGVKNTETLEIVVEIPDPTIVRTVPPARLPFKGTTLDKEKPLPPVELFPALVLALPEVVVVAPDFFPEFIV
jgi:hypothetical protein